MYRPNGMDSKCARCSLSTGKSVHGQSFVPLNKVLLILISAYPSTEEVSQNMTLAPSQKYMNAGRYCRLALNSVFGEDAFISSFSDYVFFTNAIRCSPLLKKDKKDITKTHLSKCSHWFKQELNNLPPTVPILIAGSEAVKSLLGFNASIYANRRKVIYVQKHPAVITMNPIEPSRYHPYDVDISVSKRGKVTVTKKSMMTPIFGSPPYWFKQDLLLVKELVKGYMEKNDISL